MTVRRSPSDGNRRVKRAPAESKGAVRSTTTRGGRSSREESESESDGSRSDEPYDEGVEQLEPLESGNPENRRVISKASSTASRGLFGLVRLIGAALLLGGVTVAAFLGVYRYAHTSSRFAVSKIVVDGLRRVTRASVLERAGIRSGQNVFSVDTDAVSQKILTDQWVQEARVERRLPATVRINVVEREAAALAMVGDTLLVVTRQGSPFKRFETSDPVDLPIITGVSLDEPGREPSVERRRIAVALEVLRHYERTRLVRSYSVQEVHLTGAGEIVLTVGKQGIALHLGLGPWAKKLAMAERVLSKLQGRKGTPSNVFLDNRAHPERVVVRMR